MPYVVLQQVSSVFAKTNAGKTLDKPIALKYLKRFVTAEKYAVMTQHYPEGKLYVWGAKLERYHQIPKMTPHQSLVLFRRARRVFRISVITDLLVNVPLAEHLWGQDIDGETWGIIYLMKGTREVTLDAGDINEVIGRKRSDNWQGMTSVASDVGEKVFAYVKHKLA